MTLVAILCSLIKMNPGLGIVVAILAVPALIRTCITAWRRGTYDRPMPVATKIGVFVLTLLMAGVVLVATVTAAVAAFFFACAATSGRPSQPLGPGGPDLPTLVGGLAGLVVAVSLTWFFWIISRRRRKG
jgi:hypothetical protein